MVDRDGRINTEVFMPIDMISEKLPALQVGVAIYTIYEVHTVHRLKIIQFVYGPVYIHQFMY